MAGTSRLDDVLHGLRVIMQVVNSAPTEKEALERAEMLYPGAKEQIKLLMKETYNKALQAHFVDKTASSLDAAFNELVEAL